MTEAAFWALIAKLAWKHTGDDEAVVEPVVKALAKLPVDEIYAFDDVLAAKLHALDGETYAREIGKDAYRGAKHHFSVDSFLYARCCVVANGRVAFERILADPKLMPKDMDFEALLEIASAAYERKTGDEYEHDTPLSYETFSNRAGWP